MNFYLARSFTRALEKLDNADAALAKRAALDFQIDPSQPGFKFHRVNNARDRNMWSFRVNRDLRAIVHHQNDSFILCYVDHHDDAYTWAERHRVEQHPTTGQTQIVEVVERTEVVTRTVYEDQTVILPPLADASAELLLAIGVPTDWIDWVRAASEDALLGHLEQFPEDVQHNLFELLTGGSVEPPTPLAEDTPPPPSRDIVPIEDADDLARALDAPWEQWLVFLHPEQREVVDRSYSGAARIYGSAGTGKTIVALHRVKWLLDAYEDASIFFTTYTRALTSNLEERLAMLVGDELREEYPELLVTNFHRWLTQWHRARFGQMEIATEQDILRLIEEGLEANADVQFEAEFILSEFNAIIDPYYVRTRSEYFDIPRTGRGTPLGKRQKALLWKIFQHVQDRLTQTHRRTLNEYSGLCVAYFDANPDERPFDHVVVDEAQDFSPIELQALRAIAPEGSDDIFLCSDAGQRLYGRAFSWLKNGLDIRGRSFQLKINYRTTEQIRAACEALLPESLDGPSGDSEARRARSLRRGDEITLVGCKTAREQTEALETWLRTLVVERGIAPEQIAILAREGRIAMRIGGEAARKLEIDYSLLENNGKNRSGIAIGDMRNAKGLEYRAVAIVECDADTIPLKAELERAAYDQGDVFDVLEMERNLLYVAGTRARDELFISYVGEPSQFLSLLVDPPKIDPEEDGLKASVAPTDTSHPRVPEDTPAPSPEKEHEPDPRVQVARIADKPVLDTARDPEAPTRAPGKAREKGVAQFKISPSRIAQYFGFNCQRYMRFSSAWNEARIVADNVPEAEPTRDYTEAIYASGYAWEEEVLTSILSPEEVHIASGDAPLTDRYYNPEATVEILRTAAPGTFIYEMTLTASPRFYQHFDIDPSLVEISRCRPDLVQVLSETDAKGNTTRLLRIIDMKRSTSIHATHHIQLAMYALLLEDVLRESGIEDARVDMTHGAIWLGGHREPTVCRLDAVFPHLHEFLREDVRELFTRPANQVQWHVQPKCEWCSYLAFCTREMNATDDLSRLPRMTHKGKAHLHAHGVRTVAAVETTLADPDRAEEIITPSATLSSQRYLMEARAKALNHNEVVPQGFMARGLTIPTTTEIKVFLTLQQESLGRHTYALGYRIVCAENVPSRVVQRTEADLGAVLVAGTSDEVINIRRQFVVELFGLLSRVDAYNLGQGWREKLSVQFFVYSRAEESLLTELLFAAMQERETARAARTLLMYFQGPDLILSQEQPDENVALPVAILLDIIGRVVALPIPVAYTLPEILTALGVEVDYPRDALFHHPFATFLRSDAIFEAWYKERDDRVQDVIEHIAHNLEAQAALFEKVREITASEIHTYMPKFEIPLSARIHDPLLSKLAFFAQYEAALKCTQVRGQRMIARRAIESNESVHELVATSSNSFTLSTPAARLEASSFQTWLLVRDTKEGRRAQIQYNDFIHRNMFWGGGKRHPDVAVIKITSIEEDEFGAVTSFEWKATRAFDGEEPKQNEKFLLYERFSNSLVDRNLAVLEALDGKKPGLMRQALTKPESLASLEMEVTFEADGLGLTPSQRHALEHLNRERILALWGPPGTGKTHFLATVILALMEAHRVAGKPFRVLIHAFTHAASENVLSKLVSRQEEANIYGGELALGKASGWKGDNAPDKVKNINDKRTLPSWLSKHEQCVVAGTAWAYDKLIANGGFEGVDLVVMDEASQIKVPEAAIGMNLIHSSGRIILAGDHLQLPPIVNGTYPEPDEGEVALHRSIFEAMCAVEEGRFMCQLQENFRMNRALTDMSASLLYGPGYRCGSESLADERLTFTAREEHSEFAKTTLSPESSIAVVLLHGVLPGKDNALEASLVAELTLALREGLSNADDPTTSFDDASFFEHGLFIVSPHHSQIRRIRRQLHDARSWEVEPFVDTVDKMQGQEAMAVLVSYGVSDPEFAMMEADFIYSRNRLNVSITRGRHKTVLLMPASLLYAPPRILEREEAAIGLGYMRTLVAWVRERGEETMFLREGHQVEVITA